MANIYSFSLPNKDIHLMKKISQLSKEYECSHSVLIKRALRSFFDSESIIDPVALKLKCKENANILNQVKRIVNEVENSA